MILVYSPKISTRLKYTLGLIFETILGVEWEHTSHADVFSGFEGARINYSQSSLSKKEIRILPCGFLDKRGIQPIDPGITRINDLPCLFPTADKEDEFGFDIFASSFYLVGRYEEYLPAAKDQHNRFLAENSFAYKNGFLELPLVNHYAIKLKEALLHKFSGLLFPESKYSFFPTYDIDVAYAFRGRGFLRGMGASLRSAFQLNFSDIKERLQVLSGKGIDPFDTYDLQLQWHKKYNLKAFYFFLCGDYGPFDRNISVYSTVFQSLVKKMGDYAYIGIHPSYVSVENPERLSTEVARLSKILNREIRFSRQHFLKMDMPGTYRNLIRNNIDHDFSMGYATQTGFRASVACPFYFYDLGREEITSLKVFPFAVMDGTLKDYMGLTPEEAVKKIKILTDAVKEVNGTFMSLWHNESLCECQRWEGWRFVYEQLLQLATSKPERP